MGLSVQQYAALEGISEKTVRRQITEGLIKVSTIANPKGGGNAGETYNIPVTSLSPSAFKRMLKDMPALAQTLADSETENYIAKEMKSNGFSLEDLINKWGEEAVIEAMKRQAVIEDIASITDRKAKGDKTRQWAEELRITEDCIRKWRKRYEEDGFKGLLRKPRIDSGQSKSTCLMAENRLKDIYLNDHKPTIKKTYQDVEKESLLIGQGIKACEKCVFNEECLEPVRNGWKLGSYDSAWRMLSSLDADEIDRFRRGKESWRKNSMPKARLDRSVAKVNELWISDHHVLDFYAADDSGHVGRPHLTVFQDYRSAVITGWALSFQGNTKTICMALRHGMLEKPGSPIRGVPSCVKIDNGKDYRSKHLAGEKPSKIEELPIEIQGVFAALKIQVRYSKPYTPWTKPVERWFGTLVSQYSPNQPSWLGNEPKNRPENWNKVIKQLIKDENIPSLVAIGTSIQEYIDHFNNAPHSGIGLDGLTPLEAYNTFDKVDNGVPHPKQTTLLMMFSERRKVRPTGIRMWHEDYFCEELVQAGLMHQWVMVKYDPDRRGTIYVLNNGKYIEVPLNRLLSIHSPSEELSKHAAMQARSHKRLMDKRKGYARSRPKSKEVVTGVTSDTVESTIVKLTGFPKLNENQEETKSKQKAAACQGASLTQQFLDQQYRNCIESPDFRSNKHKFRTKE